MISAAVELPVVTEGILQSYGNQKKFMSTVDVVPPLPPAQIKNEVSGGVTGTTTTTAPEQHHHRRHPRQIWQHTDAVCFDVDSTVCRDEAIDELAEFCGCGQRVAEMTRVAMNGNMTFRQALKARLDIIQPSKQDVERFVALHPPRLTPGIVDLVKALHERRIPVYLVTGGFRRLVEPVARVLNIPLTNIYANDLLFDPATGQYAGFDVDQPTSDSGGKTTVCRRLKHKFSFRHLVMVGDGATDAETVAADGHAADAFVGFGGNVVRANVKAQAQWFVNSFDELTRSLSPANAKIKN